MKISKNKPLFLISIFLLTCLSSTYNNIFALCTCPEPDPNLCPEQPHTPPYQPCTLITSANNYILRFAVTGARGAMTFIGNTLGLSKERCLNEPGTPGTVIDSIGAFTTIDSTKTVNSYANLTSGPGSPAGTTLNWRENSSSAILTLPVGAIILHAELVWSGSFGYYCSDPLTGPGIGVDPNCVLGFANGPIRLTTPDGVTHLITADPTTAFESQNPAPDVQSFYCGGNYTRTQDITPLLILLPNTNGTYTVGGVPASISALDNSHNAAGWTLAIVYHDESSLLVNNMSLFLGAQQGSRADVVIPASVSGFCAQVTPGLSSARLLLSAIEGDADNTGDQMKFGPTLSTLMPLSGPNNPLNNFFASQINDDDGLLISTEGTFCIFNQEPLTGVLIPNGRQGYDITNIDCSSMISSGQTSAFALGTTTGDDYTINALGMQINVNAPAIIPIKRVNNALSVESAIGDIVTFKIMMKNTGTLTALDVIFQDIVEEGLFFIPGSVTLNGSSLPLANPATGINLGTIEIGQMDTLEFKTLVAHRPLSGDSFINQASASFLYSACIENISTQNLSNLTLILLSSEPAPDPLSPTNFLGTLHRCKFLNETTYSLTTTWTPLELPLLASYEIFKNGKRVALIPAEGPYIYETCLNSREDARGYTLTSLYSRDPVTLRIVNE